MEPYEYSPLPDTHSIRMLTLLPGTGDQPLAGTLLNFDTNSLPHESYEPLSYVWGNPERVHDFICDGNKSLKLTRSLYHALRRLRLPDKERRIWADQICINQADMAERGEQVQFMNSIYKFANHVLVWLGEDDGTEAKAAFGLVESLAGTFDDPERYEKFEVDHTGENLDERSKEDWAPMKHLTDLPWFERAWIVQEIGTVSPATLFWGSSSMDWHVLYSVCERLTRFHHLRRRFDVDTAKVKFVFQRFVPPDRSTRHANRLSFIYELHRARHVKATDPRDRVFAFLGHYSVIEGENPELKNLVPDYQEETGTIPRVYADAAARALTGGGTEGGLIALAAVQHLTLPLTEEEWGNLREMQGQEYMPSWVPDWRTYTSHILSEPTSPHRASGVLSSQIPSLNSQGAVLQIKGVCLDVVASVSEPLKPKAFHYHLQRKQGEVEPQVVSLWKDVCGQAQVDGGVLFDLNRPYAGGGSAVLAYMQTLSNGGAATALRRRDRERRSSSGDNGDLSWHYGIPDQEWLGQAAAYLISATGEKEKPQKVHQDLWEIGTRAMAVQADAQANGHPDASGRPGLPRRTSNGEESPDEEWSRSANGATTNRVFARTERGFYVLGPKVLAEGDVVCVLWGGKLAFCLRPLETSGKFLLVGECYVHGFMNGQAAELAQRGELVEQEFELV
ncbi:heterokaryon incompatibility protein-domain-containing protein [Podospora didyma]|uniref:Heterokaryon incompatibility protein-domain-containing protein n=1 Tax=Podospora didyma TaxID=330526 RepID=A0AAE0NCC9_9PEZI|nr:heterokaryon incompatibility protein-domain-containing protein [Podospora didyma]